MNILKLTDEQLQALVGLIDAGVRATGLRSVKDTASLMEVIERAEKEAVTADKKTAEGPAA